MAVLSHLVMFNSLQPHGLQPAVGFYRQEYWSGQPFPFPGDHSSPGIEPVSLVSPTLAGKFFLTTSATWEALHGSVVKNLPAMQEIQETQVQSLGWKDPLEKEMASHSSILAWEIPWTEEPWLQSMGSQKESDSTQQLNNNSVANDIEQPVCLTGHLHVFLGEISIKSLCLFLYWVIIFLLLVDCGVGLTLTSSFF